MIVTGEASGDLHGANLVKAMRAADESLHFIGMGGEEMVRAGVELLFDAGKVSVVGVAEVVSHLPDIFKAQRALKRYLTRYKPELLIIIDLPDFNLLLAKYAKKLGVKVFYYICPQVWAWRSGRVKTIRERVDTVGVILPFEESFFQENGVTAHYVGHPLLDTVRISKTRAEFLAEHGITPNRRCVGLLPGSRKKEVASLMPVFLAAARKLQGNTKEKLTFLVPVASTITKQELLAYVDEQVGRDLDILIVRGDRYDLMAVCECVVAASGTVTLELALLDVPMVVTYKLSPLTYRLGRLLVKLQYFSLVNLIAGKEVVPELLQDEVTPAAIAEHLQQYLFQSSKRDEMLQELALVRNKLGTHGASKRAAQLALKMLR